VELDGAFLKQDDGSGRGGGAFDVVGELELYGEDFA